MIDKSLKFLFPNKLWRSNVATRVGSGRSIEGQLLILTGFTSYEKVSSSGKIGGDISDMDSERMKHLKESRSVSDLILKFNLLKNYPDSISKP